MFPKVITNLRLQQKAMDYVATLQEANWVY